MSLKSFLKSFFQFLPQHGQIYKLGYRPKLQNGNMLFLKDFQHFSIAIYQSVEPHNDEFGHLIDFAIPEACIIVKIDDRSLINVRAIERVLELFDYAYDKKSYLFGFNKKMSIDGKEIPDLVLSIERNLL